MGSAVAGVAGNSSGWIDGTANAEAAGGIIQAATRRRSLGTRKNARGRAPERSLFWVEGPRGAKDQPLLWLPSQPVDARRSETLTSLLWMPRLPDSKEMAQSGGKRWLNLVGTGHPWLQWECREIKERNQ